MRLILSVLIAVHGLIHFLGFGKAFGFAELPLLAASIPKEVGVVWLLAGLLFIFGAILLEFSRRGGRAVLLVALAMSQVVVSLSWADARFGTFLNLLILGAVILLSYREEIPLRPEKPFARFNNTGAA